MLIIFLFLTYYLEVKFFSIPIIILYGIFIITFFFRDDASSNLQISNLDGKSEVIKSSDHNKTIQNNERVNPVIVTDYKPITIDSITDKKNRAIKKRKLLIKNKISEKKTKPPKEDGLILNELLICRGVYKRTPIKPGIEFRQDVDSLFCYTKISNDGDKKGLMHVWYYQDKEVTTVNYNIKPSFNYRSWSKKTIPYSAVGDWKVEVITGTGVVLGSRSFKIVPNL